MSLKRVRTSVRLDKDDIDFLNNSGLFNDLSEGIRFCIKTVRMEKIKEDVTRP